MCKSFITNCGLIALFAVAVSGCQILGGGPSDKDLVNATMGDWKAALIAHDMDKLMENYSESYLNTQGGNKASVRDFISGAIEQGYLENTKVNLETAKVTIKDDKANVAPVQVISDGGDYVLEFKLQKEEAGWLIVFSQMQ
ncbi:MAG: hypothetical protein CEE38_11055 [Planctomycetes bacterium B3_Pla]|nr:MAG: hypothetical protein CEE38_11055 [Planctomycetes bacterium B3_Pla]